MAKQVDIPYELREFNKVFEKLAYSHDDSRIFDDFLTIVVGYFSNGTYDKERAQVWDGYDDKMKNLFQELFQSYIDTVHKIFNGHFKDLKFYEVKDSGPDWYDFFGCYYEVLASRGKKSALGQFFSPPHLCDLMTSFNHPPIEGEEKPVNKTVNDPACGSGRLLLSFNAVFPGNYLLAQDLDPMCVKMTTINMMMHGAKGEVIQGNALNPDDFIGGWFINPKIDEIGLPHIIKMTDRSQSHVWQMWDLQKTKNAMETAPIAVPRETKDVPRAENSQLTLF